ncbi:glycosyltransferase [Leptolyngbya ohadii]|uniref:glycosyltransferase n=1 Tax=Leptolyngbya ohadii TaxID=1962290 RepID=UPI000B59BE2F|nr:glycosyltransferase [Leptolyngbya ohadii]
MSFQRRPTPRTVHWAAKLAGRSLTFTGCSDHICQQGRLAGGQWYPIHNFVDLQTYAFQPHVAPDAPLVFLSRVERIKGAHTAIAIAKRTNCRLIIAGNQVNSPEGTRYWEEEIAPHLDKDGIEYAGAVNDRQKNELLGQAAALIVPIEWDEPFGIVFAEALACGTPIISCPRGALLEIVRQGIDGFLVRNIEEGCTAIEKLPLLNRDHCRQQAEQSFSAEAIVPQYTSLYSRLITPRTAQVA